MLAICLQPRAFQMDRRLVRQLVIKRRGDEDEKYHMDIEMDFHCSLDFQKW